MDRTEWKKALGELTREHEGDTITIELLDPTYGDQHEADRLPFAYVDYDERDDVATVAVGGRPSRLPVVLRHMVTHPASVDVSRHEPAPTAVRIADADGTVTLVTFYKA